MKIDNTKVEAMIDNETLGIRATSVVLTIGAVLFRGRELEPKFKGVAHCALDDALHQWEWLMNIKDKLANMEVVNV